MIRIVAFAAMAFWWFSLSAWVPIAATWERTRGVVIVAALVSVANTLAWSACDRQLYRSADRSIA
jgi:hypothetical protein